MAPLQGECLVGAVGVSNATRQPAMTRTRRGPGSPASPGSRGRRPPLALGAAALRVPRAKKVRACGRRRAASVAALVALLGEVAYLLHRLLAEW